jgi:hypothetical protein
MTISRKSKVSVTLLSPNCIKMLVTLPVNRLNKIMKKLTTICD